MSNSEGAGQCTHKSKSMSDGCPMSALPPKADIAVRDWHVRFVPKADISARSRLSFPPLLGGR
jgi:hypothetical protein